MSNRDLLKIIIKGGNARRGLQKVYCVCNGKRMFVEEREISTDLDITINVYCTNPKQLGLQENPK